MSKFNYKLFFQKRKQRISFFGVSPSFDWKFILSIGIILFLVGAVHVTFLYVQITNGSLFEVEEDVQREVTMQTQASYVKEIIEKIDLYYVQDAVLIDVQSSENFDEAGRN